ncbi:MAG: PIG-L family deacetylase [Chloroflexota bacterium]|nr:PIG-L family deacetylase [Chloroflexota bacterium]
MPDRYDLPQRAMAIVAHPDDAEFGCSGTLALWAQHGVHLTYCLLTSGDKGTHDPKMTARRIAGIREREQRAAGTAVGVKDFVFLRHHDGELETSMKLRGEVCRAIREQRPDVVFTHDPWRPYQIHPDHRVAGWEALDGIIAARDHLFFPEQLGPTLSHHRVKRVLLFGSADPNTWFDISGTIEEKLEALAAHKSQVGHFDSLAERMRGFAAATGHAWGLPAAEAFRYLELA